jgi:hypothetical protein
LRLDSLCPCYHKARIRDCHVSRGWQERMASIGLVNKFSDNTVPCFDFTNESIIVMHAPDGSNKGKYVFPPG